MAIKKKDSRISLKKRRKNTKANKRVNAVLLQCFKYISTITFNA